MKTIFKQQLDICDQQTIELPQGFSFLHIAKQNGVPCIWYECDTDNSTVHLDIYCFGTGYRMDGLPPMVYIGTVQIDGYVWHYYRAAYFKGRESVAKEMKDAIGDFDDYGKEYSRVSDYISALDRVIDAIRKIDPEYRKE